MPFKPPQKAKRDSNEREVFGVFRSHGIAVEPTDKPLDGILAFAGNTYLVEVKNGPKAPLTREQEEFLASWPGKARVVRSFDEAVAFAQDIRTGKI